MVRVMISLHVSSMVESAKIVSQLLASVGIDVWVCTDMSGGVDYRDSIVTAVKEADIVVILLNESWALSGECYDEYSLAKRLNLTSHERGVTTRDKPRKPAFIPIAFSNLSWTAHKHVELLAASTNFIVHKGNTLLEGENDVTLSLVLQSIKELGHHIGESQLVPRITNKTHTVRDSAATVESETLVGSLKTGNRYLGNSAQEGISSGNKWFLWQSMELQIDEYSPGNPVHVTVVIKELSKMLNDSKEIPSNISETWRKWMTNFAEVSEQCEGDFSVGTGLLTLTTKKISVVSGGAGSVFPEKNYKLVAYKKNLIGSWETIKHNSSSTCILLQF